MEFNQVAMHSSHRVHLLLTACAPCASAAHTVCICKLILHLKFTALLQCTSSTCCLPWPPPPSPGQSPAAGLIKGHTISSERGTAADRQRWVQQGHGRSGHALKLCWHHQHVAFYGGQEGLQYALQCQLALLFHEGMWPWTCREAAVDVMQ